MITKSFSLAILAVVITTASIGCLESASKACRDDGMLRSQYVVGPLLQKSLCNG